MKARPRKAAPPRLAPALLILALPSLDCVAQSTATEPQAIAACASINDTAERLACYDKLAGRSVPPAAVKTTPPAAVKSTPPAAVQSTAPAAVKSTPAGATAQSSSSSSQSFGLYAAEHPKPPVSPTLEARVLALGQSAEGRMTVSLDGAGLWEIVDDADPLLAAGDTVTIRRAALGSYIMDTPTKRTHRVHRLQ
jgi:hypothetical protein